MTVSEEAVREIRDSGSLIAFLRDELNWKLPDTESVEDVTFEWTADTLNLHERTESKLRDGTVRQLQPTVPNQPWGIFLVEFNDLNVYKTRLREILRGLVPRRKRDSRLPFWNLENILFICTTLDHHFTFAHFKGDKPERARLVRFSWAPDEPLRTVCEYNLPNLKMPDDLSAWTKQWQEAFDVQKVTDAFFEDYTNIFLDLQNRLRKQTKDADWAHDFALQFLNRIMFIYFVQKKGWIGNDKRFMKTLWDEHKKAGQKRDAFYDEWLSVLFFEAFNNKYQNRAEYLKRFPEQIHKAFAAAPYLNGGLFYRNDLDDKHSFTIADEVFARLFDNFNGSTPGFLERYNFTISEDTPLDQEVAVDPEMIGKVYESLVNIKSEGITDEDLRGKAGIFYTPRVEIDLMCRLSLSDWLTNQLGQRDKDIIRQAVFSYSLDEKREVDPKLSEHDLWGKLDTALRSVTVLDIASGSGSFLVGMLLVLDDLQARANNILGVQETAYQRRKRIIGQSLYGVDVMDWAVHVAELRLWLQLMIETELHSAELKLTPLLPNLSFKVRCGDSLVQEVGGINMGLHTTHSDLSASSKGKLRALKGEKLNYYQGQFQNSSAERKKLEKEEFNIFRGILLEKQQALLNEIAGLKQKIDSPQPEQMELVSTPKQSARQLDIRAQNWTKEKEAKESELSRIKAAVAQMKSEKDVPFVWDIAFVEVFEGDRKGFDIVIGNPPYVRQQKIADPYHDPSTFGGDKSAAWKAKKREYKTKLQRSTYEAYPEYFGYNRSTNTASKKLGSKSDLYAYFYFHGLRLLNLQGCFCFITSNSWLDAAYGADLQEFLLKRCEVKLILDNEVKRSFAQADINTAICLISAPNIHDYSDNAREYISKFVMFKVPFEEALSPIIFDEIDHVTGRFSRPEIRVVAKSQSELLEDGRENADQEEVDSTITQPAKYEGDKWGGKYLRAPDIFFTVLEKGESVLRRLNKVAQVETYLNTGGADDFFFVDATESNRKFAVIENRSEGATFKVEAEYVVPFLESPRQVKCINIDKNEMDSYLLAIPRDEKIHGKMIEKYVKWGERKGYSNSSGRSGKQHWWVLPQQAYRGSMILWPCRQNDKHYVCFNPSKVISHRFYRINPFREHAQVLLAAVLNWTGIALFAEVMNPAGLGEGVLDVSGVLLRRLPVPDIERVLSDKRAKSLPTIFNRLSSRPIKSLLEECGFSESEPIRRQRPNPLPDRKALDDVIFEVLGLTSAERDEVYRSVCELVQNRLKKAESI